MTRPQRATPDRKLTRSPEPRRPLLWSIEESDTGVQDHNLPMTVHEWTCLLCASGTGQAPTRALADQAAHAHWRANHNHHEEAS